MPGMGSVMSATRRVRGMASEDGWGQYEQAARRAISEMGGKKQIEADVEAKGTNRRTSGIGTCL